MADTEALVEQETLDLAPLHEVPRGVQRRKRNGDPCSSESPGHLRMVAF